MKRIAAPTLPEAPLAAAGYLHAHVLPAIEAAFVAGFDVMVTLPPADHSHREWRRALAAGLARAHTPQRANVVAGEGAALDAFEAYLALAPGITGQYLEADTDG